MEDSHDSDDDVFYDANDSKNVAGGGNESYQRFSKSKVTPELVTGDNSEKYGLLSVPIMVVTGTDSKLSELKIFPKISVTGIKNRNLKNELAKIKNDAVVLNVDTKASDLASECKGELCKDALDAFNNGVRAQNNFRISNDMKQSDDFYNVRKEKSENERNAAYIRRFSKFFTAVDVLMNTEIIESVRVTIKDSDAASNDLLELKRTLQSVKNFFDEKIDIMDVDEKINRMDVDEKINRMDVGENYENVPLLIRKITSEIIRIQDKDEDEDQISSGELWLMHLLNCTGQLIGNKYDDYIRFIISFTNGLNVITQRINELIEKINKINVPVSRSIFTFKRVTPRKDASEIILLIFSILDCNNSQTFTNDMNRQSGMNEEFRGAKSALGIATLGASRKIKKGLKTTKNLPGQLVRSVRYKSPTSTQYYPGATWRRDPRKWFSGGGKARKTHKKHHKGTYKKRKNAKNHSLRFTSKTK